MMSMVRTWKEFWNRENRVYVSRKHVEAHYRVLGGGVLELLPRDRPLTLLDWGCGEALAAPVIAQAGVTVLLYDPVPRVEDTLSHFAGEKNIRVLKAEELAALPLSSIDAILVHSVIQYMTKEDFKATLERFSAWLKPGGTLLLGDVVPSGLPMIFDVIDLLWAGLRHGFFFGALSGMVMTFFSDYRAVRHAQGFTTYTESEMLGLLKGAGFNAERMSYNIGLCAHRMLFRAIKK